MPEYIDRDAVYHAISVDGGLNAYEKAYCIDIVRKITAADVAPVRYGRWVDRIVDENEVIQPWMKRYYCSECLDGVNQSWFKFCPNCGARMDGGDKNDE